MRQILRQFRYLTAAAQLGSLRRAAEVCGVDQSNVSRALRQLEDHLGVELFERAPSGVRLTAAGYQFLVEISPAIEQLEAASRTAGAARRGELGVVRIGITTSLAGGQLRDLLHRFIKKHPRVIFDVHDGGRSDHLMALRARQLDGAIVTGYEPVQGFEVRKLWTERIYVALTESHPLTAKVALGWPDLKNEQFIVSRRDPGPDVRKYILGRIGDFGAPCTIEEKAASQETIMNLVALGQGITLVSAAWAVIRVPGLTMRPLTDQSDIVPFSIVWACRNENPAFRKFLQMAPSAANGETAVSTLHKAMSVTL